MLSLRSLFIAVAALGTTSLAHVIADQGEAVADYFQQHDGKNKIDDADKLDGSTSAYVVDDKHQLAPRGWGSNNACSRSIAIITGGGGATGLTAWTRCRVPADNASASSASERC
ncbi:hypothetical protein XA68_14044 [Ophiocordyceps unilateralis]|uniref:Pectate lyase n=1 Tax=Ophiocordyceps unilateralis TaxID=268505 RepID=A0A2A9PB89_OPHUN|nr:hypothetical protein XA68_14044 [Ophiocordyceps unilateralis]